MYMMNDREFSNRKETLHGEFYENALKYPERIALIYENEKVSYKMLRLYALRAANYMWQRGVRRNDKIVVILPRGIGQVAALLGILAIGAAYVPIAMKQPLGRRKKIIENVKPALVLQDEAFLEENPWTGCIENNSKDSEYVFHTEEPPLFKVLITKRIEGNFFHLLVDLIVSDFASVQLLISEMGELLKGASLEKIRYKFSDYAMFNQQRKGSLKWHQDRMYWLERLKKLPEAPILPQDGRAADKCENTYEFYRFQKHINQSDWKRIKEIAGEYGVTVSSVLIGIYAEVISRWSFR